jgi:hypothetical protein
MHHSHRHPKYSKYFFYCNRRYNASAVVYQPVTYSAESFITCSLHYPQLKDKLATLDNTVSWLTKNQNADGSWGLWSGSTPSGDSQRSPRALSLLQWYAETYGSSPVIEASIKKFVAFILDPVKARAFGLNCNTEACALATGFVGLAVADLLKPWVTFGSFKDSE